jgi:UTP--glucose-1-phosphate uridylyltransferase
MVTKAVIPAAGFGTRMLPAAKAVPKEMLPILDRPTIQYVVEECAEAGLSDVLLVTSRDKKAIEDHFDRSPELEQRLGEKNQSELIESVLELLAKVKVHSVRQASQRGLGDAVMQARRHVGGEPFVCLLGDAVFSGGNAGPARQLVSAFKQFGTSVIGLEIVPEEKVSRYGIVGGQMLADGMIRVETLVEKPTPREAPSDLAVAARYLLTPEIFECLEETKPGKGGEVQLTDALRLLAEREPVHGIVLASRRHDIGNPIDWLKTNIVFAARDPQTWSKLAPMVRELLSNDGA